MLTQKVKDFLNEIYQDSQKLEQWLEQPEEKSKEWELGLEPETIKTLNTTLQFMKKEIEQMQELRKGIERTVKKINNVSRHSIVAFYIDLGVQVTSFILAIVVISYGLYALFSGSFFTGVFLCIMAAAYISYFATTKPIQNSSNVVGSLVKTEVALNSWLNEMIYWQAHSKYGSLEEKQIVAKAMRDAAKWTVMLIEDYSNASKQGHFDAEKYSSLLKKTRATIEKLREKAKNSSLGEKIFKKTKEENKEEENKSEEPEESKEENKEASKEESKEENKSEESKEDKKEENKEEEKK